MSLLLPIFSLLYYLYYLKYKKIVLGIILITSIVIFNLTFSRTTFILIFLFISLILINDKYIEKLKFLFLFENGILGFCLLTILIFIIMKILFENKDYKAIRIVTTHLLLINI